MVIAPDGFLEEAVSENIFAGNAMGRRALYQYGSLLEKGPRGQVDSGLGKGKSNGTVDPDCAYHHHQDNRSKK